MSQTCFISHNASDDERVFVFRLQTLASSSGIKVLLPHRMGKVITAETQARIEQAGLVIAFLTESRATQVNQELGFALAMRKPIVAIHRRGTKRPATKGIRWIEYDQRRGLGPVEDEVAKVLDEHLSQKNAEQGALVAVLGIALLALLAQGSAKK